MDEALRLAYLEAMGIEVWRRREEAPAFFAPATFTSAEDPHQDRVVQQAEASSFEVPTSELDWEQLAARVARCRACTLHETRIQTVFGVGNRQADLMVIGEAPGADEDRQGEPFVGRAGQLLNLMLRAIGLGREQVFIANVLKCRPPGNRDPLPDEVAHCQGFLQRQMELLEPKAILSVGRISAQNLLKTTEAIGRLRGRIYNLGVRQVPMVVTYHPAYLLRSPEEKAKAWQDLQVLAELLGVRHATAGLTVVPGVDGAP